MRLPRDLTGAALVKHLSKLGFGNRDRQAATSA